jgi:RNA polymerase sigma-70 factor (sigma-E family)
MGSRDEEFTRFVAGNATALLRTAFLLTGDRGAAEDLLQDAFERVYVAWPRVTEPFAYTRTALVRGSVNRWRSRSRRPEQPLDGHDLALPDGAEERAEQARVLAALARLPARQRATVVLRFWDDLTEAATADVLSCSVGTVKSQTARALARLRTELGGLPRTAPDHDRDLTTEGGR